MFWGFFVTALALAVMLVCSLIEIFRVPRIVEQVDRRLEDQDHAEGEEK